MSKAIILHGWGAGSNDNWFPWLKNELNKKIFDVYVPNLPNSLFPDIEEQNECLYPYYSEFADSAYIIGHSLGGKLSLKFIEDNEIKNSIVILVAPAYPGTAEDAGIEKLQSGYKYLQKYCNTEISLDKINSLNNKFYIFLSDNDEYINQENAQKYFKQIKNTEIIVLKNKGHFLQLDVPEILEYIN